MVFFILTMVAFKKMMMKTASSRALVIRINLFFLAIFLILYSFLLLCPSASDHQASLRGCSVGDHKGAEKMGMAMKSIMEDPESGSSRRELIRAESVSGIRKWMRIGVVNMEEEDVSEWEAQGEVVRVAFERVSTVLEWKHLFPEWIDEEEEADGPSCPEIPMPDFEKHGEVDMVVAKLPCRAPEAGWQRDVLRLQVHLVVANLAARRGKAGKTMVALLSKCMPMMELFKCDEIVGREGDWWYYRPDLDRLEQKVMLPVGSCNLAMPIWGKGVNEVYDVSKLAAAAVTSQRQAYATVLHSSEAYVCGAITLAQSLLQTGTKRDLILLHDASISRAKRDALARAGWKLRLINRIRNPRAEKNSYNEYNYSKLRLWQLNDYVKVIFVDADIVVLRSLDPLFALPEISAAGNDGWVFNSGIMVVEPSNCTFRTLMDRRTEIVSYNGGDQGFLNEAFTWWHRLPRRVNFLKNVWSSAPAEVSVKDGLFEADPPVVHAIHYLGHKPWFCYRDYDCNWDSPGQQMYASDAAHARWWRVYDTTEEGLRLFCRLSVWRKKGLDRERELARSLGLKDGHWRINITDPRRFI